MSERRARRAPRGPRSDQDFRRRMLSQNLLRDSAADEFLAAADLRPDCLCLEVGAGEGILTRRLAERCREVIAYEIDEHMAGRLAERLHGVDNVRVMVGDFLRAEPPPVPFHVVGNVPFSITSAIVDWCLRARPMVTATLITQLEYAKKRTGGYGRWSLVTVRSWPEFSWELRARIARRQFRPVPRVDAGVLAIRRRPTPLIRPSRHTEYVRMVELGFTGVGGSLFASLRQKYPSSRLSAAFRKAGIGRQEVVAFVHPDQWVELFRAVDGGTADTGGVKG